MKTNQIIKLAIGIIILGFSIQSCGYRMTEEDKYPDMPIYPHTSNANYVIDSLFSIENDIKYTNEYMYVMRNKTSDSSDRLYLSVLDKDLTTVKEIPIESSNIIYTIDVENNVYIIGKDKKLYKYAYPWDTKTEMTKVLDVNETEYVKQQYADIIEQKTAADSSFYVEGFIDSIFNNKIKALYDLNDCVLLIYYYDSDRYSDRCAILNDSLGRQSYAIIRDYSELWQSSYQNRKASCDSIIRNLSNSDNPNLILEQAAFGNKSSGNHYVFGFTPYGYDYYKITIDKDTISFKIENGNLNYPIFTQTGNSFTKKILLYDGKTLYIVKKK